MVTDIERSIDKIKALVSSKFPTFGNLFSAGLSRSDISDFETEYKVKLPDEVVAYLELVNGELPYENENMFQVGVFLGLELLALEDIKREMNIWKEVVAENPEFAEEEYKSYPEGAVKEVYCDPESWVGLTTDGCGNSIGVDLNPGPNGKVGQVIVWGRDYIDERIVIFDSWADFLNEVIKDLESEDLYKIEDNAFEFLSDQVGNYMDYLFEKKLAEYKKN